MLDSRHGEVGNVVEALARVVKIFRLYPSVHPACEAALAEAFRVLEAFLARDGILALEVRRDAILFEESALSSSGAGTSDLVQTLYPEGCRALTFLEGIDRDELRRLLVGLAGARDGEDASDDLLARLLRIDLPHVIHRSDDPLAPARLALDCLDPLLEGVVSRIRELQKTLAPGLPQGGELDLVVARDAASLSEPASLAAFPELSELYLDTKLGAERASLARAAHARGMASVVERAIRIALAAPPPGEKRVAEDSRRYVESAALALLDEGDVEAVLRLLEGARSRTPDVHAALVTGLAAEVGFDAFVRAASGLPADVAKRYLQALGDAGTDAAVRLLTGPRLEDEASRSLYVDHVKAAAAAKPDLLRRLAGSRRQGVGELALDLLLAGEREGPGWKVVREISSDSQHPLQARARRRLAELTGETDRLAALAVLASGVTKDERVAAWERLVAIPGCEASFDEAAAVIESKTFLARDPEEQVRACLALSKLDRERARVLLRKVLTKKSITRRAESERLSQIAGETLRHLAREDRERTPRDDFEGAP